MAIKVTGGKVRLAHNSAVSAIVKEIDFPSASRVNGQVPVGAKGTLYLTKEPDHKNYGVNDVLNYSDSNSNNDATLRVTGVIGVTKLRVTRTA